MGDGQIVQQVGMVVVFAVVVLLFYLRNRDFSPKPKFAPWRGAVMLIVRTEGHGEDLVLPRRVLGKGRTWLEFSRQISPKDMVGLFLPGAEAGNAPCLRRSEGLQISQILPDWFAGPDKGLRITFKEMPAEEVRLVILGDNGMREECIFFSNCSPPARV